ncbi:hypothetical protein PHET_03799 [Paragonimus heterotremus]|uniref:Uncharacterized protein n=1 Tax=Paragonimus heterotremus TaxID=100268 RepID=A0A8J4TIJ8_9TREM|nr:hypothetical protein PHET_03799 [Paragonimus heterotremus]
MLQQFKQAMNPEIVNRCLPCGDFHLPPTCSFHIAICRACRKAGHIRKTGRKPKCHFSKTEQTAHNYATSSIYTLLNTQTNSQFLRKWLTFGSRAQHTSIADIGNSEAIIPKGVIDIIYPNTVLKPTIKQIQDVTGHSVVLVDETTLSVQSEELIKFPVQFLIPSKNPFSV